MSDPDQFSIHCHPNLPSSCFVSIDCLVDLCSLPCKMMGSGVLALQYRNGLLPGSTAVDTHHRGCAGVASVDCFLDQCCSWFLSRFWTMLSVSHEDVRLLVWCYWPRPRFVPQFRRCSSQCLWKGGTCVSVRVSRQSSSVSQFSDGMKVRGLSVAQAVSCISCPRLSPRLRERL